MCHTDGLSSSASSSEATQGTGYSKDTGRMESKAHAAMHQHRTFLFDADVHADHELSFEE